MYPQAAVVVAGVRAANLRPRTASQGPGKYFGDERMLPARLHVMLIDSAHMQLGTAASRNNRIILILL
jgi:hypothetical protein